MATYVLRRVLQNIPLLLLISIVLFVILHNAPGGPLAPYLQNPHITPADIKRLEHNFGLDRPLYVQYWGWLEKVLTGDLGYSTSNSESVVAAMLDRLPATLELMGSAFFVSIVLGVSMITNLAAGLSAAPIAHAEVLETGRRATASLAVLLTGVLDRL